MTLGTGELRWRNIHCPSIHEPLSKGIYINGILYYLAEELDDTHVIVCFDVRSEEFKFIKAECFRYLDAIRLINYKGKLGGIRLPYATVNVLSCVCGF